MLLKWSCRPYICVDDDPCNQSYDILNKTFYNIYYSYQPLCDINHMGGQLLNSMDYILTFNREFHNF